VVLSAQDDAVIPDFDRPCFTFIPWDYDNSLGIDHVGHLFDTELRSERVVDLMVGPSPSALWSRVSQAAYLESDTPHGPPFTGRQFTNDRSTGMRSPSTSSCALATGSRASSISSACAVTARRRNWHSCVARGRGA
jgi:hypothetical protein